MNTLQKIEYNKIYREKNRERLKLYAREFRKNNQTTRDKKRQSETIAKWKKKNPERRSAHGKVFYAVKIGKLKKEACKVCGVDKVHAHHEDYNKPLEVIWLCPMHHYEYDIKINKRKSI